MGGGEGGSWKTCGRGRGCPGGLEGGGGGVPKLQTPRMPPIPTWHWVNERMLRGLWGYREGGSLIFLSPPPPCPQAPQYARWLAGCRLAARGRSLATAASGAEARGVLGVLGLHPGGGTDTDTPNTTTSAAPPPPPDPRLLLAPRFQRKFKAKQVQTTPPPP